MTERNQLPVDGKRLIKMLRAYLFYRYDRSINQQIKMVILDRHMSNKSVMSQSTKLMPAARLAS